jgi:hypothetical protein
MSEHRRGPCEAAISKPGQIQQTVASDLCGSEFWFILAHS